VDRVGRFVDAVVTVQSDSVVDPSTGSRLVGRGGGPAALDSAGRVVPAVRPRELGELSSAGSRLGRGVGLTSAAARPATKKLGPHVGAGAWARRPGHDPERAPPSVQRGHIAEGWRSPRSPPSSNGRRLDPGVTEVQTMLGQTIGSRKGKTVKFRSSRARSSRGHPYRRCTAS